MSLVSWNWRKLGTALVLLVGAIVIVLVLMQLVEMTVYLIQAFIDEAQGDR